MTDTTAPIATPSSAEGAVPSATAPATAAADKPTRRPPHPVLLLLAERYPALFGAQPQPLKRGIFQDLAAALGEDGPSKVNLKQALGIHTRSRRYLQAMASGAPRVDLQGQVVEATAPEHVLHALLALFARSRPRPQETPEQMQQRLQRRIGQLLMDSGLSAEEFVARAQLQDAQAQATLEAALVEVAEQDARAVAVQRSFTASGAASPAAFAQMYGMHPKAVERQLARAQQLQQREQV